jgi:protein tyrosine kinase modulator
MADETRIGLSLARALTVWRRRKWLAILSFATVSSATATVTAVLPEIYQSAATVLVVGQQVPVDFVRTTVTGSLDARLQTISQEILSRSRLEELINRYGLYPNLRQKPSSEAPVERMRRDIEVRPTGLDRAGGTVAFTIKYQGRDSQTVARVTNTLASYYIEENMKVRERQAMGTAEFLRVQLADVKARLESQERRVSDFKRRNLGELPTQMDANLATLDRLNTQFRLNGEKQIRVRDQRQELARLLETMTTVMATPVMATPVMATPIRSTSSTRPAPASAQSNPTAARLARMKQDLADLRTRFSERYPDVLQMKEEIAALERQLAEAKRESPPAESVAVKPKDEPIVPGPDPQLIQMEQVRSQLDVEIKSLKEEEATLRTAMATYQARVDNTPRRDLEFQELSRDYDSTRDLYRTLLKRYEEAQLSESLEQRQKGEQFRILEPAVPATTPSAPNRSRLLLMGLALSAGLAVGLVLLVEQLDSSFHTIDELRARTTFPVLVGIPRIVTDADIRRRWWRVPLATAAAIFGLALIVGASYFVALGNEQLLRLLAPGRF